MRVLLIDDHALFRRGLQELLQRRGIDVVGAVGDGQAGCELAQARRPDVILLDLRMPGLHGLSVLERLNRSRIEVPVVMLTTSIEEHDLVQSLRAGARGYLLKDMEPDELIDSLHQVVAGQTAIAPEMAGVLAKVVQGDDSPRHRGDRFSELTPRELEILCHVAEGQSNKAIARDLGITDGTVKLHVRSILRKLGVSSRVEAAVLAVEQDLCRKPRHFG